MARWRAWLIVAVTVMLAWGIRGQHGHERGAAFVGAAAGLALAAVTGRERWVWAALWGSLGFALGGTISYGQFIGGALDGSRPAVAALIGTGLLWGALGGGALAWGYRASRPWERALLAAILVAAWACLEGPLSATLDTGGLRSRGLLLASFSVVVIGLVAYYTVARRDLVIRRLALAGALGLGAGFLVGPQWLAWGPLSGWGIDWWKWMEHTIGLLGGLALAWGAFGLPPAAPPPLAPWHRWAAFGWLLIGIPMWLWANNLVYWWWERRAVSEVVVGMVGMAWLIVLAMYLTVGAARARAGRWFQHPWSPQDLRGLYLAFLWFGTATAVAKTWLPQPWGPTQTVFVGCAVVLTGLVVETPAKGRS